MDSHIKNVEASFVNGTFDPNAGLAQVCTHTQIKILFLTKLISFMSKFILWVYFPERNCRYRERRRSRKSEKRRI